MVLSCLPVLNPIAFTGGFPRTHQVKGKGAFEHLPILFPAWCKAFFLCWLKLILKHCAGVCFILEKKNINRILSCSSLFTLQG